MEIRKAEDLSELELLALQNTSYSRLNTFSECSAAYFYTYILKSERLFGPAATLGNVVHGVLEDVVGDELDLDVMMERFDVHRADLDPDNLIDAALINAGREMLGEFRDRHASEHFDVIDKEMSFNFVIRNFLFRGYIDLVTRNNATGRMRVTDYKAQPLWAGILTPEGWRKMGSLKVGDEIFDADGGTQKVTGVHPQGSIPSYQIEFSDGTSTVCSDSHRWTYTLDGEEVVGTTLDLLKLRDEDRWSDIEFPQLTQPLTFDLPTTKRRPPLDPYFVGYHLAGGNLAAVDPSMLDDVQDNPALSKPSNCVPYSYLYASVEDRMRMVEGIENAAKEQGGKIITKSRLAYRDIKELYRSLGIQVAGVSQNLGDPFYFIWRDDSPKRVTSITKRGNVEMRCITVSSERQLYITDDHILTHNSGKWEVAKKDIPENLQLGIYALGLSVDFPEEEEIEAELYYLRSGRRKLHVFTPDDLLVVKERLFDLTEDLLEERFFKPTDDPGPCIRYCDFARNGDCKVGYVRAKRAGRI